MISAYLEKFNELRTTDFEQELFNHSITLNNFHIMKCSKYKKFVESHFQIDKIPQSFEDLPFIPVEIFKNNKLYSCKEEDIYKTLLSSGTTSQKKSMICLDKINARNQTLALSNIFTASTGYKRPNILIVDSPSLLKNRKKFNARVAAIIGFSSLCRKSEYALNDDYSININKLEYFLDKYSSQPLVIFGFTSIIWKYFLQTKLPKEVREKFSKQSIMIHGGGWKNLEKLYINRKHFKDKVREIVGIKKITNYYGMIEQAGSIFMECQKGFLHTNPLCTILARSDKDLRVIKKGNIGIAQVISAIPSSYPGHSLLTDDLIEEVFTSDCPCGLPGKAFKIHGRLETAEIRGCSDTLVL